MVKTYLSDSPNSTFYCTEVCWHILGSPLLQILLGNVKQHAREHVVSKNCYWKQEKNTHKVRSAPGLWLVPTGRCSQESAWSESSQYFQLKMSVVILINPSSRNNQNVFILFYKAPACATVSSGQCSCWWTQQSK